MSMTRSAVTALAIGGILTACDRATPDSTPAAAGSPPTNVDSSHVNLSSLDPLRAAFNTDSGKVRAIFLASPT